MGLVSVGLSEWYAMYCSGGLPPLPVPGYAVLLALSVRT
jgi:hypothetical protein